MTILGILITLLAFTGTISGQEGELTIAPEGDSHTRAIHDSILFTCHVTGLGREINPNLEWHDKDNKPITDTTGRAAERMYIESEGKHSLKLYITNIENGDSGLYTCKATINGERRTKAIQLHLYKDITFDNAPPHQTPKIFTDALIACEVSGQPKPTVSWLYQNERISDDNPEHVRYSVSAKGLTISNMTAEDNGVYTCRAEVLADGRMKHRLITVEVHIPPKVTSGPGDVEGTEEQQFVLECQATGKPTPKWEFFKDDNNNPLSSTERRQINAEEGRITFNELHRDDTGKYRCMAINSVGSDSGEGYLDVVVKPFIFEYREVKGEEGKSTTLTCITEGNPPPEMTFRKVGRDFDYEIGDNDNGRAIVEQVEPKKLSLAISALTPNDTANYTCRAKNSGGQHALNSTITVEYKPRFPANHVRQVFSWAGKVRNMTCDIIAEPAPVIRWLLFNQELRDNETFKIFNMGKRSSLQITVRDEDQIWIYSEYTCRATNNYGSADLGIKLDRATVPDQPRNAEVVEESPTMVRLQIDEPENDGGVKVLGYRVEWQHNFLEFQTDDDVLIENLAPSTRFIFRIRAKNEVGVGNSFELSHLTEDIHAPSKATWWTNASNPLQEEDIVSFSCEVESDPPSSIDWRVGDSTIHVNETHPEALKTRSELSLALGRAHNGLVVTCGVTWQGNPVPVGKKMTLEVYFPPSDKSLDVSAPNLTANSTVPFVAKGESLVLVCNASGGNPLDYSYTWARRDVGEAVDEEEVLEGEDEAVLDIDDVTPGVYACIVSNEGGSVRVEQEVQAEESVYKLGHIVGGVVAGLLLLLVIIIVVVLVCKRRGKMDVKSRKEKKGDQAVYTAVTKDADEV